MSSDQDSIELARELIRRASVTPADAGCQELMIARLERAGFEVTRLPFGQVSNFWAVHGSDGPVLAFAGHTDVVPTGPREQWRHDPFAAVLEDGMLHGRGAADMKASLAAMITACERFVSARPDHPGRLALLITSDEEGPAVDGTVKVMQYLRRQKLHIDWCIVGEPSSSDKLGDTVKNGRRGSLNGALRVIGSQGHVAYPQLADNPIHRIAPALAELAATEWDQGNEYFPATSFQVSNIQAGTGATNVIPGEVEVKFNFRFSTELDATTIEHRVESILRRHRVQFEIDWVLSGEPFLTREGALIDAVLDSVETECGYRPLLSTSGGTSDGRFIAPGGTEVIELGPCNATIHKLDECMASGDIPLLASIYTGAISRLLND